MGLSGRKAQIESSWDRSLKFRWKRSEVAQCPRGLSKINGNPVKELSFSDNHLTNSTFGQFLDLFGQLITYTGVRFQINLI